jgi:hypothetical protein
MVSLVIQSGGGFRRCSKRDILLTMGRTSIQNGSHD